MKSTLDKVRENGEKTTKKIVNTIKFLVLIFSTIILPKLVLAETKKEKLEEVKNQKLGETKFVKGSIALIQDATQGISLFLGVTTALGALICVLLIQTVHEESDVIKYKKNMKKVLICGALGTAIAGIVSWVMSYFR